MPEPANLLKARQAQQYDCPFLCLHCTTHYTQGDADADQESRIYGAIRQRLESSTAAFQPAACVALASLNAAAPAGQQQQQRVGLSGAHMAAGLEMCRMSKLLLIAGMIQQYILACSRLISSIVKGFYMALNCDTVVSLLHRIL